MDQICFTGESHCSAFEGHFLKPNICTVCMKSIEKHRREAIDSEESVVKALEYTQSGLMVPSLVVEEDHDKGLGAVYIGGFKAAVNEEFLKEKKISHILNVAGKGLGMFFGPKYRESAKKVHEKFHLTVLNMDWEDSVNFLITDDDFLKAASFIHEGRKAGGIIVHCAQGKSRSGAAVCAYVMAAEKMQMLEAIEFIQKKRKMVDPNPHFRMLLVKFEKSQALEQLTAKLSVE